MKAAGDKDQDERENEGAIMDDSMMTPISEDCDDDDDEIAEMQRMLGIARTMHSGAHEIARAMHEKRERRRRRLAGG